MLNKSAFILSCVALVLTSALIISISGVFGSAVKPDYVYNVLVRNINTDMSSSVEFYNENCGTWNNQYTLNIEELPPENASTYNYQICKLLHDQFAVIPVLNSKALSK